MSLAKYMGIDIMHIYKPGRTEIQKIENIKENAPIIFCFYWSMA